MQKALGLGNVWLLECSEWGKGNTPSPEPHHSLMKINTSVFSKEEGAACPGEKGKRGGGGERMFRCFASISLQAC